MRDFALTIIDALHWLSEHQTAAYLLLAVVFGLMIAFALWRGKAGQHDFERARRDAFAGDSDLGDYLREPRIERD